MVNTQGLCLLKVLITSIPCRPSQSNTISTSLGSFQPHCINAQRLSMNKYPPLSTARYSFIQSSELKPCRVTNHPKVWLSRDNWGFETMVFHLNIHYILYRWYIFWVENVCNFFVILLVNVWGGCNLKVWRKWWVCKMLFTLVGIGCGIWVEQMRPGLVWNNNC